MQKEFSNKQAYNTIYFFFAVPPHFAVKLITEKTLIRSLSYKTKLWLKDYVETPKYNNPHGSTDSGFLFYRSALGNPNLRIQRYGSVIGVKFKMIEEYKKLHADPWPDVINKLHDCNIKNYSIYLREIEQGKFYLFSYFEYTGNDFDSDMAKMAADPVTQEWWKHTDPCQIPIPLRG